MSLIIINIVLIIALIIDIICTIKLSKDYTDYTDGFTDGFYAGIRDCEQTTRYEVLKIINETIYQYFDVCNDEEKLQYQIKINYC